MKYKLYKDYVDYIVSQRIRTAILFVQQFLLELFKHETNERGVTRDRLFSVVAISLAFVIRVFSSIYKNA